MSAATTAPALIVQTPRTRFMATPENIIQHRKMLDNVAFQKAMDVGMAELVRATIALSGGKDLDAPGTNQAMATTFAMLSGAQQFIEIVSRLAEPYQVRPASVDKIESLEQNR